MARKIRRHTKFILPLKIPLTKETLYKHGSKFLLNNAQSDRISFSLLKNRDNKTRKIENISYEINIENRWEWVVRYDDHSSEGELHRHNRISLDDEKGIVSASGIKKYKNKDFELDWVCKDIKRNYLKLRRRILKNSGLDLY